MVGIVYSALEAMFGGGLLHDIANVIEMISAAIVNSINGSMGTAMSLLSGIAMSLMVIYFFMDLTNQASRDLFTFEKLITAFVRLLVAFAVLLFLADLIKGLVTIGDKMFKWVNDASFSDAMLHSDESAIVFHTKDYGDVAFNDLASGVANPPEGAPVNGTIIKLQLWDLLHGLSLKKIITVITALIFSAMCSLMTLIAKALALFTVISTGIQIIARAIFAPLAVVQLFEDGTKSAGIRYLKKLFAKCLSMACMVLIMYAAQKLSNTLIAYEISHDLLGSGATNIIPLDSVEAISDLFSIKILATVLVAQFAMVGGMSAASHLADDIVGV